MGDKTENMVAREVASLINRTKFTGVRPNKPKKTTRDDLTESEKLRMLADAYEIYEDELTAYNECRKAFNMEINRLCGIMYEKAIEENFPDDFPTELSGKIYAEAYERRHSEGYIAVLETLEEIVGTYVECWWKGIQKGKLS